MGEAVEVVRGHVVTPDGVLENGAVVIEDGVIAAVRPEGAGDGPVGAARLVLPGLIDLHSDAIEQELQPRPGVRMPPAVAFRELEKKLCGQGITTIYHAIAMHGEDDANWVRMNETVPTLVQAITAGYGERHLIRHRVHLRFEVSNVAAEAQLLALLASGSVDLLSFMDHGPGQGQYRDRAVHEAYLIAQNGVTREEAARQLAALAARPRLGADRLAYAARVALGRGIPLASHDDDEPARLDAAEAWGARISEFPVALDVARDARRRGLAVVMGAPNILQGRSHSGNLSALEAVEAGAVDALCSDYYPSALLHAVFILHRRGMGLNRAVNLASLGPARAVGIDARSGAIAQGKAADLLLVAERSAGPVVEAVWVGGRRVYGIAYREGDADADAGAP